MQQQRKTQISAGARFGAPPDTVRHPSHTSLAPAMSTVALSSTSPRPARGAGARAAPPPPSLARSTRDGPFVATTTRAVPPGRSRPRHHRHRRLLRVSRRRRETSRSPRCSPPPRRRGVPPPTADARGLPELACDAELATAASGLQFCESVVGSGKVPAKGAQIKAHYTGRLTDGRVFDSSYSRGSPLSFKVGVGQVIRGWDEGILGGEGIPPMKVGGKRVLVIPAELGYGDRGAGGGLIPGGATLKFDVELVDA